MTNDLKYATRSLAKRPGFTAVAIITLALGIGASTAIFSVLEAVLLRPLPYPEQERIVEVVELNEAGRPMQFTDPNFVDLRARSRSFEALASYQQWFESVAGGREPVRTRVAAVSSDFFRVLGVKPVVGRLLPNDTNSGAQEVAVVSNGFWKRLLGGETNLEGLALRFANRSFAVIGVLPPHTDFPPEVDVWFPRELRPMNTSRSGHNCRVAGRLRSGVSVEQASAEIAAIGRQLKAEHGTEMDAVSFGIQPLRERHVKDVRRVLVLVAGAVGLLLTIACSNVANLLLVRASGRRKEVALRAALGASQWQLARQFIAEALLLTLLGGAVGMLLAFWGVELIERSYSGNLPRVGEIGVSPTVLLFTLTISVLTGVALGLVPALHTSRRELQVDLQETGRGGSGGAARTRARNILIVAQVALTLMLLVTAGLLGRSFQRLLEVDPGFEPQSAVAMTVSLPAAENVGGGQHFASFYSRLLARLEALPGVTSLGGVSALPLMSGAAGNGTFIIHGGGKSAQTLEELQEQFKLLSPAERSRIAEWRVASAGYFEAMRIPLVRGRSFRESDGPDAPHVALISQSLARRYWPNEDPIGRQIQFGGMDGDLRLLNIIGVVGDVRDDGLDVDVSPTVYVHYLQRPLHAAQFSIVVRARGDATTLIEAMRREARALNPEVPTQFRTLEQVLASSLDNRRFSMVMLAAFAGAALLLAMVGLYGIMAFITSERTTEIGIRMALGAQRADVLRLILHQSFILVSLGVVVGIVAAVGGARVLQAFLYGISATDFLTYGGVIFLLGAAALLASYIPARRAMRVDPIVALRLE
ncbi:MAG TPA: ABC transporter permease [Chthoniobacterales bacterium]|nr:ABC transporter permease [Chthoniobacterales bacterium]